MITEGARSRLGGTRFSDVRWFDELDSTNRYLLEESRRGAGEGAVAVADHQTAGRGRLGRSWVAPPGASLLVSILLRPQLPPDRLHLVTAAVALSAADACRSVAGVDPQLKWPNDLMVGSRKLAGVLAEADIPAGPPRGQGGAPPVPSSGTPGPGPAVVVGVGINVNWPEALPEELEPIAVSLNRLAGREVDRSDLLVALLVGLEGRCGGLAAGGRPVASEYRARCSTLGRLVRVDLGDETFTGRAMDVSEEGHLLVDVGACTRTVNAGDVVHLRSAG